MFELVTLHPKLYQVFVRSVLILRQTDVRRRIVSLRRVDRQARQHALAVSHRLDVVALRRQSVVRDVVLRPGDVERLVARRDALESDSVGELNGHILLRVLERGRD